MTSLLKDAPVVDEATQLRRSLRLEAQLVDIRAAGGQALLTGPGVHDLFIDPDRKVVWLPDLLRSWCKRNAVGFVTYRMGAGVVSYPTLPDGARIEVRGHAREVDTAPDDHPADELLRVVADLRRAQRPAVLVIDYADLVLPERDEPSNRIERARLVEQLQALTSDVAGWHALGLQLVLIDRAGGISRRLAAQPGVHTIDVTPPDLAESTMFLEQAAAAADDHARLYLSPGLTPELGGRLCGGLLLRDINDDRVISTPHRPLAAEQIVTKKGAAIRARSSGTLDLLDPGVRLDRDVAGMHGLRLCAENYLSLGITTLRFALCGPPGTGKTHSAGAVANLLGVPMISFGQVLGEYLGQSERNMRTAWALIRAMAPVLVFIDEADQGLLGARDGSGHSGNEAYGALRSMMFEQLGDPFADDGISVVLTTNVPTRLDARTRSRFTFVPVLYAAGADLAKIMRIHALRSGVAMNGDPAPLLTEFTDAGGVLAGRSAQEVFTYARVLAAREHRTAVSPDDIAVAIGSKPDKDWTTESEYSALVSLCHPSTTDALPWVAAAHLGEPYPVPGYLRPYLNSAGIPDLDLVGRRVAELEADRVWR